MIINPRLNFFRGFAKILVFLLRCILDASGVNRCLELFESRKQILFYY